MSIKSDNTRKNLLDQTEIYSFKPDRIDYLAEHQITFALLNEGFTIEQIARIRGKSIEDVKNDIIASRLELRAVERSNKLNNDKDLNWYMGLSKDERLAYIGSIDGQAKNVFKSMIYEGILKIDNIEDLMVLVWTAGELRDPRFLGVIYPFLEKRHSNARRIAYSAIGKIASPDSIQVMELGLMDDNAQVRQYCAKALGNMGDINSIRVLSNIVNNKRGFEKEYVIRACEEALNKLKSKYNL